MWRFFKKTSKMHFWRSQATSWTKKIEENFFQIFSLFIGGTLMIFLQKIPQKSSWKILRVPYEKWKNLKKIFHLDCTRICSYDHNSSLKPIGISINTYMAKPIPNVISDFEKKMPLLYWGCNTEMGPKLF